MKIENGRKMAPTWPTQDESVTDTSHWHSLWEALGGQVPPRSIYEQLLRCYGEPHRAYHTRQHVNECLHLFQGARDLCVQPEEVAIALWFHDAIYQPRRSDNEARSAEWLTQVAAEAGLSSLRISRLQTLVMATRHEAVPQEQDAQVLVDIDLAILGAPLERFEEYERQVRQDSGILYRRKRAAILAGFLKRSRIYSTEAFFQRFEESARNNLQHSLTLLAW